MLSLGNFIFIQKKKKMHSLEACVVGEGKGICPTNIYIQDMKIVSALWGLLIYAHGEHSPLSLTHFGMSSEISAGPLI